MHAIRSRTQDDIWIDRKIASRKCFSEFFEGLSNRKIAVSLGRDFVPVAGTVNRVIDDLIGHDIEVKSGFGTVQARRGPADFGNGRLSL